MQGEFSSGLPERYFLVLLLIIPVNQTSLPDKEGKPVNV
jgi:hypothetical protein